MGEIHKYHILSCDFSNESQESISLWFIGKYNQITGVAEPGGDFMAPNVCYYVERITRTGLDNI